MNIKNSEKMLIILFPDFFILIYQVRVHIQGLSVTDFSYRNLVNWKKIKN